MTIRKIFSELSAPGLKSLAIAGVAGAIFTTAWFVQAEQTADESAKKEMPTKIDVKVNSDDVIVMTTKKTKKKRLFQKQKKKILQPPFPDMEVKYQTFTINAKKGARITYDKTGSTIEIPENAFLNEYGEPVKGKVEVHYREFHNPFDTYLSGIPMNYDSAGTGHTLESAGMLEILASADGKGVYPNPERPISIDLATNEKSTSFNLYFFDQVTNEWKFKGKDQITCVQGTDCSDEKSVERPEEESNTGWLNASIYGIDYSDRLISESTGGINKLGVKNMKHYKPVLCLNEDSKPDGKYKHNIKFTDLVKRQPEMAVFEDMVWHYDRSIQKKDTKFFEELLQHSFKDGKYIYRYWDRVFVTYKQPNDYFTLLFKKDDSEMPVNLYPSMEGRYFDKQLSDLYNTYKGNLDSLTMFSNSPAYRALKFKQKWATYNKIRRSFQLDGFGIWNCDQIYKMGDVRTITAAYMDKDRIELNKYNVTYIDGTVNSVFSYGGGRVVRYNPSSKGVLIAALPDNRIGYTIPDQLSKVPHDITHQDFCMEISDDIEGTIEKLKQMLN